MNSEIKLKPIAELSKLPEHMNEALIIQKLLNCIARIEVLEKQIGVKQEKPKKEPKYVYWAPVITEILSNGKIWSTHAIMEEARLLFPDLPPFSLAAVQHGLRKMWTEGEIFKITHGNYRKK